MIRKFFIANKLWMLYGASLALLLFVMRWLEFRLVVIDHKTELYAGAIAVVFTVLGIWLAKTLSKPKMVLVEKKIYTTGSEKFERNLDAVEELGLSKRELEVLELMATGLSNNEIAESLFVSLNTVKTHNSKIFEKLNVNRRTQAIDLARQMGVISL